MQIIVIFIYIEEDAVRYFEEKQRAQISADVMEPNVDKELITRG